MLPDKVFSDDGQFAICEIASDGLAVILIQRRISKRIPTRVDPSEQVVRDMHNLNLNIKPASALPESTTSPWGR
jgi:hypothetical protein